jgi:hypothetical protein
MISATTSGRSLRSASSSSSLDGSLIRIIVIAAVDRAPRRRSDLYLT